LVTSPTSVNTDFTRDVIGRYVCNGLDEALRSTDTISSPDARPFSIIIIGGGSFGLVAAQHLFFKDKQHRHRILILEAGRILLPEHVQNLPMFGLGVPPSTVIDPGVIRAEVWGLPWRSTVSQGFPGLAYCVGGRSIYFGGWCPQLLEEEMPSQRWPPDLIAELNNQYFKEARTQLGVNITNDFIFGRMHEALRKQLFDGINNGKITDAIPLMELPNHLDKFPKAKENLLKLEGPLAVQGNPPRSGYFPINKFSSVPLLIESARAAYYDSDGDDVRKRLMIVPDIHVTKLVTIPVTSTEYKVTEVQTNKGNIPVPEHGIVIIALGTIESARLALLSFQDTPHYDLIGKNLMVHMRSNMTVRIPRTALTSLSPNVKELSASALFVKGRHNFSDGGVGYFHLQITAAGLNGLSTDSEAELFKKIPDIDLLHNFLSVDDTHVIITIRGIGETQSENADSRVTLSSETDGFGVRRAFIAIADPRVEQTRLNNPNSKKDFELWEAMDKSAEDAAKVFAGNASYELLGRVRDGLGTTHHESGTLWIGEDQANSVTNSNCRFHDVVNVFAVGPSLFPSIGSPNPMLTGIALARRTADKIIEVTSIPAIPLEPGYVSLFDGTDDSFKSWQEVGPHAFFLIDGNIVTYPGNDHSVLFYSKAIFKNFNLRLQFRLNKESDNSGVFIRFRFPLQHWPDLAGKEGVDRNKAWVAVHTGFEVQIDDKAAEDKHHTGAIYNVDIGTAAGQQTYNKPAALTAGSWNDYEIQVLQNSYSVKMNGTDVTSFTNIDATRGQSPDANPFSGYIGIQAHTGLTEFRNIRIRQL
jgi:choline dehydrogenase-like flavoprotein